MIHMHIAIIGSWYDSLMTLGLLKHTHQQFSCIIDAKYWPREQKSSALRNERVQASIDYAISLGAEKIILPPIFELLHKEDPKVVPLYQTYVLTHVLPKSRVGKLGILADTHDTHIIQKAVEALSTQYQLTDFQSKTKKFQSPFSRWTKDVSIWSDFLRRAKPSDWMLRKYIKNDLRYFQDADVDSLIPTSYTHFYRETVLRHHLNFKKIRRQEKTLLQDVTTQLLWMGEGFDCKIFANDDISKIIETHPWIWFVKKDWELHNVEYQDW